MDKTVEDLKKELIEIIDKEENVNYIEEDSLFKININETISVENILDFLKKLYSLETELSKTENKTFNIFLNLKSLDSEKLTEVFKYSITVDDLTDPIMILNIANLIKTYNNLEESYFDCESTYFKNTEDLIDVKLNLMPELKAFIRRISIYFISLFKSYNKVVFTPTDNHIVLPNLYRILFLSNDMATLCGILANSENFQFEECVYIDNAIEYLGILQQKSIVSFNMLDSFFEVFNNGNRN